MTHQKVWKEREDGNETCIYIVLILDGLNKERTSKNERQRCEPWDLADKSKRNCMVFDAYVEVAF